MMKIVLKCFLVCCFSLTGWQANAQMYRNFFQRPNPDSLQKVVESLNRELDQADSLINAQSVEIMVMQEQAAKKEESANKLEKFIDIYKSENSQLNQTNKILIIFNCLGAVLLLLSLVYIMSGRNKSRRSDTTVPNMAPVSQLPSIETPVAGKTAVGVEDRLIQIERLARLREGGLLTSGEFEKEKERILRGG